MGDSFCSRVTHKRKQLTITFTVYKQYFTFYWFGRYFSFGERDRERARARARERERERERER